MKDLFLCLAQEELAIEKLRQMLATIRDFEPYAAFKRIDRDNTGFITTKKLSQFVRENGFREFTKEDFVFMIRYFDQDNDMKLNFHE
jgi:Ca2+-binding EF-hand superfamily protein